MISCTKEELTEIQQADPNYMIDMLPYALALDVSDIWFQKMQWFNLTQPGWYATPWSDETIWVFHLQKICTFVQNDLVHPFFKRPPNYLFEETVIGVLKEMLLAILEHLK